MSTRRIGIRQILAPAAAVALITGGIISSPDHDGPTTPSFSLAAISSLLTPPEDVTVTLEGDYSIPLKAVSGSLVTASPSVNTLMVLTTKEDGDKYELVIEDGDMSAKVNGQPVPDDRIVSEGSQVVILDEDGNPMATFTVGRNFAWGAIGEPRSLALEELKTFPQIRTGVQLQPKVMLGITMSDAPTEVLDGIVVDRVLEGLPAGKAGLMAGDIIVSIKGLDGVSQEALRGQLRKKSPGEKMHVRVLRDGAIEEHVIKLEAYDGARLGISVGGEGVIARDDVPGAYNWFRFHEDEEAKKAFERAMGDVKGLDHDEYTDEVRKAIELAMKQFENGEWREKLGDMSFNLEIDPEVTWRYFSDAEGQEFVFPKDGGAAFRWETDDRTQELENRLQRLEEKIDRLEQLIDRLTEDL